ncbi:hypothetical protein ACDX34_08345 [Acinetobacter bereziniae]|uniref:hypothetical protein n=1 Tax=Acinetobacter bereziniae TaxID=106648 RepID=UPI0039C4308C
MMILADQLLLKPHIHIITTQVLLLVQIIVTLPMILVVHIRVTVHQVVMTVELHLVRVGINMKNVNHLSPIYNHLNPNQLIFGARSHLKKHFIVRVLDLQLPELKFNIELDFPFSPKRIPKVKNRKVRRACYQSFRIYKNSFKPIRYPRLSMINDRCLRPKSDDLIDAISYAFSNRHFYSQYHVPWGIDSESRFFKGNTQK